MNINTVTQEELNKFFDEYYEIAYQGTYNPAYPAEYADRMRENYKEHPFCLQDGYRLGISGWGHTKVRPYEIDADGTMHWKISANADKLTAIQKKIIAKLEAWAATK